jgi:hypothetical protein
MGDLRHQKKAGRYASRHTLAIVAFAQACVGVPIASRSAVGNRIVLSLFPLYVITVGYLPRYGGRMQKTRRTGKKSVRKECISRSGAWLALTCEMEWMDRQQEASSRTE